jgi:hypothetical protein
MTALSELGVAAVTYSGGWSWPVFRLRRDSKLPATPRGFHDATTDSATVVREWTADPHANVGIATGQSAGILVLDIDPGGDVTMHELRRKLGPLPTTLAAVTPRGFHGYFQHPDVDVRCSAGRLGTGVDVRANGGYVVGPPSRIGSGRYGWRLAAGQSEPLPSDIVELPAAWIEALATRTPPRTEAERDAAYVRAAIRAEIGAVRFAPEGTRNTTLNASAFAVARFATSGQVREDDLVDLLLGAAVESGLEPDEAQRTIRSAFDGRKAAA